MTSTVDDPLLGSKMLEFLSKQLKTAKTRIEQLESVNNETSENARNERARAAEDALETLRDSLDDATTENRLLRASLEDTKEQKRHLNLEKEPIEPIKIDKKVSTDEVDVEPDVRISELERQVQRYREKYKAAKAEKKELTEALKNLEAELSDVRPTNQESFKPPALTPLGDAISWEALTNFVKNLKPPEAPSGRFPEKDLRPVCHISVDLTSYLLGDAHTSGYSKEFLYLPDLLIWCPDQINAIALGALHSYDPNAIGHWRKKSMFEALYNKEFALFDQSEEYVFYIGTYKAICLLDQLKDGISVSDETEDQISQRCLSSLVKSTAASASYAAGNASHNKHHKLLTLNEIQRLYLNGTLNVEPLGLQYVGFNDSLYKNLIKRFQGARSRVVIPEATTIPVTRRASSSAMPPKESNGKRKAAGQIVAPSGENKRRRDSQGAPNTMSEKAEKRKNQNHARPCSAGALSSGAGKKPSSSKKK